MEITIKRLVLVLDLLLKMYLSTDLSNMDVQSDIIINGPSVMAYPITLHDKMKEILNCNAPFIPCFWFV